MGNKPVESDLIKAQNTIEPKTLIFYGQTKVGKSSLYAYLANADRSTLEITRFIDFKTLNLSIDNSTYHFNIAILSTEYEEILRGLIKACPNFKLLLIFDLLDPNCIQDVSYLIDRIKPYLSSSSQLLIVGNKLDLAPASKSSYFPNYSYFEISTLTGDGIQQLIAAFLL